MCPRSPIHRFLVPWLPRVGTAWGIVALLAVSLVFVGGCKASDGPEAAAVSWLEAQAARDADALYGMLSADDRARVDELYGLLRDCAALIDARYPEAERQAAHAAVGTDVLGSARSPAALFTALVTRSAEPVELSRTARWGLRPRSSETRDGAVAVTTLGGDTVLVAETDDGYAIRLGPDDAARLTNLLATARSNLGRLQKSVSTLDAKRFGGPAKP